MTKKRLRFTGNVQAKPCPFDLAGVCFIGRNCKTCSGVMMTKIIGTGAYHVPPNLMNPVVLPIS